MQHTQVSPANKRFLIPHAISELILGTAAISLGIILIPSTYNIKKVDSNIAPYGLGCYHARLDRFKHFARSAIGIWSGVAAAILGLLGCALKKKDTKQMYLANIVTGLVTSVISIHGVLSSTMPDDEDFSCIHSVPAMHIVIMALSLVVVPIAISHTVRCINLVCSGSALHTNDNLTQRSNQIGATVVENL